MSDWVRPLFSGAGVSRTWHVPRLKTFTTTTECGESLEGPLEVAREERAERDGRCAKCVASLGATAGAAVPQRRAEPKPPTRSALVKRSAPVKRAAPKKAVKKPAPAKRAAKAPAAKRPVRRSRRRTA